MPALTETEPLQWQNPSVTSNGTMIRKERYYGNFLKIPVIPDKTGASEIRLYSEKGDKYEKAGQFF